MIARKLKPLGPLALMHLIVFIWGFTGLLGGLISVDALTLVWIRVGLALGVLVVYGAATGQLKGVARWADRGWLALGGWVIAAHWVTFFHAIKIANISVALACLSTGAFFAAILEPLVFRRRFSPTEGLLGAGVVVGVGILFSAEVEFAWGIGVALLSALLSATFSVLNGKLVQRLKPVTITLHEMAHALAALTLAVALRGDLWASLTAPRGWDWLWLILLATVCTAYAFIQSVKVMQFLSPFTVMLTINLEPVYGIALAVLVFGEQEQLSGGFYAGAMWLFGLVLWHTWRKRPQTLSEN